MIDTLIRWAIARRWLVMAGVLGLVLLGLWSAPRLPLDAVPDITNVQVQINTEAPGYSPLEVEQRISFPLESGLAGLPQLAYTRSLSRYGLSQITLVFAEGTDIYFARSQINERLGALKSQLPSGLEPTLGPIATGLGEIFSYRLSSSDPAVDTRKLRELQDWLIRPRLLQVPGVVEVNAIGGYERQYQVQPDPVRLLQFGLSLADLQQQLQANNANRGAGFVEQQGQQLLVRVSGQLQSLEQIRALPLVNAAGLPLRLGDLAEVSMGSALRTGAASVNGEEAVLGTAMMLMGANSRQVASDLAAKLAEINLSLPPGVSAEPVYDRSWLVAQTLATVQKNLLEGALLVIAVLFALLGNLRAALITAAVIPISLLMTLSGMLKAGVSANLMSLGALDFGLIVDGAVIIVENCIRRLGEAQRLQLSLGKGEMPLAERLEVAREASSEVMRPSLFGVAIITLVYLPLFSLSGVEGKMFQPMAATVVMALAAALLLSLTFIPAAVALLLKGPIAEGDNRVMAWLKRGYGRLLALAFNARWWVLTFSLGLVVSGLWLAPRLGSEFVPQLDEGDIALHAMRIPGTSLTQSLAMQLSVEQRLLAFPQVDRVFSKIGTADLATDPMPPSVADTFVMLKDRELWPNPKLAKADLVAQMEAALEQLPGNNYEFTQPIQMRFNELISGVRADLGIKLVGDDLAQLEQLGQQLLRLLERVPGAADARVQQQSGLPSLNILPKRQRLAELGLSLEDLQQLVVASLAGTELGAIYEGDRRFPLVLRLPLGLGLAMGEGERQDLSQLAQLPVSINRAPGFVPLGDLAELEYHQGPSQINRENGKRQLLISANVRGRDLGSFVAEVQQTLAQQLPLPPGYWLEYGGSFEQLESARSRLQLLVPLTLLLVFGLLVMALGQVRDALVIFTGVPLALCGGVLALWWRDMPLSMSAGVGFIALSGVAVLNGLVMLAFIRQLWTEKKAQKYAMQEQVSLRLAVIEGAQSRLRPVLMTALVASLGFVPMALNIGIGAEVQRPLATVVIGGLITSSLLTLVVLPLLYDWVHSFGRKAAAAIKAEAAS